MENYQIIDVAIADIAADANQPRESLSDEKIEEYTTSMKHEGFKRENALHVIEVTDGKFQVKNGNHRFTAAGKAGLTEIPVIVVPYAGDEADYRLDQVADNNVLNMRPLEILNTAQQALESGKGIVHIAKKLGKSAQALKADLPILSLPPEIRRMVNNKELPKVVARRLAEFPANRVMTAFKWAMKDTTNSEKMLAGITAYAQACSQTELKGFKQHEKEQSAKLADEEKGVICMHDDKAFTFKDAAKLYDRLEKIVGKYDKSPIGNGHSAQVFTAKRNSANQIELMAKSMKRISEKIIADVAVYQAAH